MPIVAPACFCSTMLWWLVVSSNGRTGWHVISFTLNLCPDALLLCPILNTWLNLLLSAKVSCHKFKVPLSCFVTKETMGDVSFCSSSFWNTYRNNTNLILTTQKTLQALTSAFGFVSSSSLTLARLASLLTASLTKCFKLFTVLYKLTVVDMLNESPNGKADGIRVENETWACLKDPGWYSSNHSTTLN